MYKYFTQNVKITSISLCIFLISSFVYFWRLILSNLLLLKLSVVEKSMYGYKWNHKIILIHTPLPLRKSDYYAYPQHYFLIPYLLQSVLYTVMRSWYFMTSECFLKIIIIVLLVMYWGLVRLGVFLFLHTGSHGMSFTMFQL